MSTILQTELAPRHKSGLPLKNPVLTASGTFGFGVEYAKLAEVPRLGGIICKGITLHSRVSHSSPSILETASGLLYPLDASNPGLSTIRKKYAPIWSTWQTPVIVNIAGNELDDLTILAEQLDTLEGVAGIEMSTLSANASFSWEADPALLADLVTSIRHATALPLIVKLSPGKHDLLLSVHTAISAGADAISLLQTLPALAIDLSSRRPHFPLDRGGLSGPSLKPFALRFVYELAHTLRHTHPHIPIIGVGGIACTSDALEFLMAGATAIQVGSITFANPLAAVTIVEGIEAFMLQEGIDDIKSIVGAAL
jgi:dihydroorotate dehydrogenase (NAD+) catalytic subunit